MFVFIFHRYIGARSEALASAQLEQHGLQDMLDSVQAWVSDAEKRMSETEAMPIANDLAAVEEQLAAHEVRMFLETQET